MMLLKKNTTAILPGIILAVLGMALSGCAYSEIAEKNTLIIPHTYQSKSGNNEPLIVYGISFEGQNTVLRIKKFGILYLNKDEINIRHGLSFALEYNEVSSAQALELKMILRRYHFKSLQQFIKKHSSAEPILPNNDFKAIPKDIGRELFFSAQKTDLNDHGSPRWQLSN